MTLQLQRPTPRIIFFITIIIMSSVTHADAVHVPTPLLHILTSSPVFQSARITLNRFESSRTPGWIRAASCFSIVLWHDSHSHYNSHH